MAATFDGDNLIITMEAPTAGVLNQDSEQLYDDAKQWYLGGENTRYPFPFATSGGEGLTPGVKAGAYYQLQNQDGWRIRPDESDHTVFINGNLTPFDSSLPIMIPTVGAFTVGVFGLQPITQNVDSILTASQAADYNGQVAIDTVNGSAGTTYPTGTATSPVLTLADAIIIAADINSTSFTLKGSITLTQAFQSYTFMGLSAEGNDLIVLNGQDVNKARFVGIKLTGTAVGTSAIELDRCGITAVSGICGVFRNTGLLDNLTLGQSETTMHLCFSEVAGPGKPWVSLDSLNSNLSCRGHIGGFDLRDVAHASANVTLDLLSGSVLLAASNTLGNIVVRGTGTYTDNSAGSTVDADIGTPGDGVGGSGGLTSAQGLQLYRIAVVNNVVIGNAWNIDMSLLGKQGYSDLGDVEIDITEDGIIKHRGESQT